MEIYGKKPLLSTYLSFIEVIAKSYRNLFVITENNILMALNRRRRSWRRHFLQQGCQMAIFSGQKSDLNYYLKNLPATLAILMFLNTLLNYN